MASEYGASFPNGCFVFVDPDRVPENQSFVVAMNLSAEEATFKQLVIDGERLLKPLNPRYPLLKIDQNVVFCGVVIDMVLKLENVDI